MISVAEPIEQILENIPSLAEERFTIHAVSKCLSGRLMALTLFKRIGYQFRGKRLSDSDDHQFLEGQSILKSIEGRIAWLYFSKLCRSLRSPSL